MRSTNRNLLQAHHRRSHDDLYHLLKAYSFNAQDLFLEQSVEVDKPETSVRNIMPRTLAGHRSPFGGGHFPQSLCRRPSSEPISIPNCHLSYDHEMVRAPAITATTDEGHLKQCIRQLTEKGEPICGSPMKLNFLDIYQPTENAAQSRASSPATSLSSSVDSDSFSFISDSSSFRQSWYNEDEDEHEEQDLQSTEIVDNELQFEIELGEGGTCEDDYRRLFTSLTNIPHLTESTMTEEDAVDSASSEVTLDRAILNHQVPRLEVEAPEVEAERRLRAIRQVAAELRQISLDYERRVQQQNSSGRSRKGTRQ